MNEWQTYLIGGMGGTIVSLTMPNVLESCGGWRGVLGRFVCGIILSLCVSGFFHDVTMHWLNQKWPEAISAGVNSRLAFAFFPGFAGWIGVNWLHKRMLKNQDKSLGDIIHAIKEDLKGNDDESDHRPVA